MPKYKPETEKVKAEINAKQYIASGFNQTEMANRLGRNPSTICRNVDRLPVRNALQQAFRKIGISTRYKAKKFKELLEAKKIQDCDIFVKDENGKLKVNRNSNDFIEVEDNTTRVATLRLLCQVEGDVDKENGHEKGSGNIIIQIVRPLGSDTNERIHINRT